MLGVNLKILSFDEDRPQEYHPISMVDTEMQLDNTDFSRKLEEALSAYPHNFQGLGELGKHGNYKHSVKLYVDESVKTSGGSSTDYSIPSGETRGRCYFADVE